jgi:hypothetical protein
MPSASIISVALSARGIDSRTAVNRPNSSSTLPIEHIANLSNDWLTSFVRVEHVPWNLKFRIFTIAQAIAALSAGHSISV